MMVDYDLHRLGWKAFQDLCVALAEERLQRPVSNLSGISLARFISYRSNYSFAQRLIELRPDMWKRLDVFSRPLKDDMDVDLLTTLHEFGLLPEERRRAFVEEVHAAAIEEVDDSFLENEKIGKVLTNEEKNSILSDVETEVFEKLDNHVERLREEWESDYEPNSYFDTLRTSVNRFAGALLGKVDPTLIKQSAEAHIQNAVWHMEDNYSPERERVAPTQQSAAKADSLDELFRDVDE
jgi:hypothetical protein